MSTEKNTKHMHPSERVREVRTSKGLSQADFAGKLGYPNYQAVKDLESGRKKLRPHLARLIQYVFGINENWLLTGNGEMIPQSVAPTSSVPISVESILKRDNGQDLLEDLAWLAENELSEYYAVSTDIYRQTAKLKTGLEPPRLRSTIVSDNDEKDKQRGMG